MKSVYDFQICVKTINLYVTAFTHIYMWRDYRLSLEGYLVVIPWEEIAGIQR